MDPWPAAPGHGSEEVRSIALASRAERTSGRGAVGLPAPGGCELSKSLRSRPAGAIAAPDVDCGTQIHTQPATKTPKPAAANVSPPFATGSPVSAGVSPPPAMGPPAPAKPLELPAKGR